MDQLDSLLLQYLPDTGLCARGKRIQADRRARMKAAIQMWFLAEAAKPSRPVPNFPSGGTASGNLRAVVGDREGPELIIDEMQLENINIRDVERTFDRIDQLFNPIIETGRAI